MLKFIIKTQFVNDSIIFNSHNSNQNYNIYIHINKFIIQDNTTFNTFRIYFIESSFEIYNKKNLKSNGYHFLFFNVSKLNSSTILIIQIKTIIHIFNKFIIQNKQHRFSNIFHRIFFRNL